jgi:hypothetical protein
MLRPQDRPDDIEKEILITQLVSLMDPRTKWIFLARVCGQSWASIAVDLGTTTNGAEVMYNRGVRTIRERIQKQATRKRKHFIATGGE